MRRPITLLRENRPTPPEERVRRRGVRAVGKTISDSRSRIIARTTANPAVSASPHRGVGPRRFRVPRSPPFRTSWGRLGLLMGAGDGTCRSRGASSLHSSLRRAAGHRSAHHPCIHASMCQRQLNSDPFTAPKCRAGVSFHLPPTPWASCGFLDPAPTWFDRAAARRQRFL